MKQDFKNAINSAFHVTLVTLYFEQFILKLFYSDLGYRWFLFKSNLVKTVKYF